MTRTVFHGAQVFDGTGSEPYPADVAIEAERIVAVGPGLDGDKAVEVTGLTLLPGLFDTHVHVTLSGVDLWQIAQQPFSYQFYLAQQNLRSTLEAGITSVRDADGADLGIAQAVEDGLIAGPRMQISLTMLSQTGGHGNDWLPSGNEMDLWVEHPGRPPAIIDKARSVIDIHQAAISTAVEAGVRIAMGTDSGVAPHGQNLRELEFMVGCGMTRAAALEAATRSAAQLMGVDGDLGTIEAGKLADLVVVEGDPFAFDDLADRIQAVWKSGSQVVGAPATQD